MLCIKDAGENKWGIANGRKCTTKGMKVGVKILKVVGNSENDCCIEANCFENGFNNDKCGNPIGWYIWKYITYA